MEIDDDPNILFHNRSNPKALLFGIGLVIHSLFMGKSMFNITSLEGSF